MNQFKKIVKAKKLAIKRIRIKLDRKKKSKESEIVKQNQFKK